MKGTPRSALLAGALIAAVATLAGCAISAADDATETMGNVETTVSTTTSETMTMAFVAVQTPTPEESAISITGSDAPSMATTAAATPGSTTAAATPGSTTAAATPGSTKFQNCSEMHKVYPHGVGRPGAVDHTSATGKPVTNFFVSAALYNANKHSDRDDDGIACEQR